MRHGKDTILLVCFQGNMGALFSKVPIDFRAPKAVLPVGRVCIQDQSFNNSENDTMKLSV